jgi:hypothetical protein
VRVTSPTGAPTDVSISDFGAEKRIRIGSPSRTVSGTQTYVVSFHLENVVNDIGDGTAEFYFDHVSTSNEYVYKAPGRPSRHLRRPLVRRVSTELVVRRPSALRRRARRRPSPPRTSARAKA